MPQTFLPLGTTIKIQNDVSFYVIVSRAFTKNEKDEILPIYQGVPHPYGQGGKYKTLLIRESDILEVIHKGYDNEEDDLFVQQRLDELEERLLKAQAEEAAEKKPPELTHEEKLSRDPFYKFREMKKAKEQNS